MLSAARENMPGLLSTGDPRAPFLESITIFMKFKMINYILLHVY